MESGNQTLQVAFGDYNASLINGKWHYDLVNKSAASHSIKPISKYKDPVQFKVMEVYEGNVENEFKKQLGKMVIDIVDFLKNI